MTLRSIMLVDWAGEPMMFRACGAGGRVVLEGGLDEFDRLRGGRNHREADRGRQKRLGAGFTW
jgi:hypothetical protein